MGVSEDAAPGEMQRQYRELHNDLQVRLTNAPTPVLKKTYQQRLQELQEAAALLLPGASAPTGDLPAASPVAGPAPRARVHVTATHERSRQDLPTQAPPGMPRSTVVAIAVAAIFFAACASLAIARVRTAAEVSAVHQQMAELQQRQQQFDQMFGSQLYRDALRVTNVSKSAITIVAAAVVYVDEKSGKLQTVHSGTYGYPKWEIRPGGSEVIETRIGRGRDWNGPVLAYSFSIEYPGAEPFLQTGIWSQDVQPSDKAVAIDLD